jgi:hypothetical protein
VFKSHNLNYLNAKISITIPIIESIKNALRIVEKDDEIIGFDSVLNSEELTLVSFQGPTSLLNIFLLTILKKMLV